MLRKTDSNNPAEWLYLAESEPLALSLAEIYFRERYPGFDLEEPDWPDLRAKVQAVEKLLAVVKAKLGPRQATN